MNSIEILYEDNHYIIVNKRVGDIVQGDKTGDEPLSSVIARYIAERDNKPGDAFIGVPHRLDRPVSGVAIFAKRSKGLERINELFRESGVKKIYWAIVAKLPELPEGELTHYLLRNEKQNRSYAHNYPRNGAKEARLRYKVIASSDNYHLLEVELLTGRHHQIRCQLSAIGSPIKGDLKYGAPRSNPDGGISLHARSIRFTHPVTGVEVYVEAQPPKDSLWDFFLKNLGKVG
jgi:23S rRNA pseudouridine1911/1915/1917 synthase